MFFAGLRSAHPFGLAGKRNQPRSSAQTNQCSDSAGLRYKRGAAVLLEGALALSTGERSATALVNRHRPTQPRLLQVRHRPLVGIRFGLDWKLHVFSRLQDSALMSLRQDMTKALNCFTTASPQIADPVVSRPRDALNKSGPAGGRPDVASIPRSLESGFRLSEARRLPNTWCLFC